MAGAKKTYNKKSYTGNVDKSTGVVKKHSGCTRGQYSAQGSSKKHDYVRGWNYSARHGMRTFLATAYEKTKTVTSKSGVTWENWCVKISAPGVKDTMTGGMYEVGTGRVIMKELQMIMNPKAPNGGYCGKSYQ